MDLMEVQRQILPSHGLNRPNTTLHMPDLEMVEIWGASVDRSKNCLLRTARDHPTKLETGFAGL